MAKYQECYINNALTSLNEVRHNIEELKETIRYFNIQKEDVQINILAANNLIEELFCILLGRDRNKPIHYYID